MAPNVISASWHDTYPQWYSKKKNALGPQYRHAHSGSPGKFSLHSHPSPSTLTLPFQLSPVEGGQDGGSGEWGGWQGWWGGGGKGVLSVSGGRCGPVCEWREVGLSVCGGRWWGAMTSLGRDIWGGRLCANQGSKQP